MSLDFKADRPIPADAPSLGFERYDFRDDVRTAVRIAVATERPLLVLGPPGCGKSQLAEATAWQLGIPFDRLVVTSRTEADELMWRYDALGRLRNAQDARAEPQPARDYVEPSVLWNAFDPEGAKAKRVATEAPAVTRARPGKPTSVVLVDEIDKAEPEVPNNLLDVLDARRFYVTELRGWVGAAAEAAPLVVLTSNRERALSPAFLRRCIVLELEQAGANQLVGLAERHFGPCPGGSLYQKLADRVEALRGELGVRNQDRPGTAEYLDAVRACRELGIAPPDPASRAALVAGAHAGSDEWELVERLVLAKRARKAGSA